LRAIIGIEMSMVGISGKFKASQNRTDADAAGVVQGLTERGAPGDQDMAKLISARRPAQ
jgi:transcriptional regulator